MQNSGPALRPVQPAPRPAQ
ncbi:hypothetical protein A2U01_0082818, partial [Trifolium medium]|nr:hypothetical protein [Trifolium medium]